MRTDVRCEDERAKSSTSTQCVPIWRRWKDPRRSHPGLSSRSVIPVSHPGRSSRSVIPVWSRSRLGQPLRADDFDSDERGKARCSGRISVGIAPNRRRIRERTRGMTRGREEGPEEGPGEGRGKGPGEGWIPPYQSPFSGEVAAALVAGYSIIRNRRRRCNRRTQMMP